VLGRIIALGDINTTYQRNKKSLRSRACEECGKDAEISADPKAGRPGHRVEV